MTVAAADRVIAVVFWANVGLTVLLLWMVSNLIWELYEVRQWMDRELNRRSTAQ